MMLNNDPSFIDLVTDEEKRDIRDCIIHRAISNQDIDFITVALQEMYSSEVKSFWLNLSEYDALPFLESFIRALQAYAEQCDDYFNDIHELQLDRKRRYA